MKRIVLALLVLVLPVLSQAVPHGIQFSWVASAGAASYNLYCGITANGEPVTPTVTGIVTGPYLWTTGTPGTTYYCKMTAVNAIGQESGLSNETLPTTFPAPPSSPTNVTATQK